MVGLKTRTKSLPTPTLPLPGNPIDHAPSVLERKRPCRKGAIRTFRLCSFDFGLERLDQVCPVCRLGKLRQIEIGYGRLIMDARHECRDRIPYRSRDVAKIGGLKQGEIALLGVLPRLQPSGADAAQAGSRLDT